MIEEILYFERVCTSENRSNLNYLSLSIEKGSIHLVTGTDGSGIYLLPELLTGKIQPSFGSIYYKGEEVQLHSRERAEKEGIFFISSELAILQNLSLTENISYTKPPKWEKTFLKKKKNEQRVRQLFQKYGLHLAVDQSVSLLTRVQSYELLICRAVLCGAKLIICQELGEGLQQNEIEEIQRFLFCLKKEGLSFLLLNVNFESALYLAEHISIIRDGMLCYSADRKEISFYSIYKCLESNPNVQYRKVPYPLGKQTVFFDLMVRMEKMILSLNIRVSSGEMVGVVLGEGLTLEGEDLFYRMFSQVIPVRGHVLHNGRKYRFSQWVVKYGAEICFMGIRYWEKDVFHDLNVREKFLKCLFELQRRGTCIIWNHSSEAVLEKYCSVVYHPE